MEFFPRHGFMRGILPVNGHPVPLVWVGSDHPLHPLGHAQCAFCSIRTNIPRPRRLNFRFHDQGKPTTGLSDEVDRDECCVGSKGQGGWSPTGQYPSSKKRHTDSFARPVFIGDHNSQLILPQDLEQRTVSLLLWSCVNGFLARLQPQSSEIISQVPIVRGIHQNMGGITLNG